MSRFVSLLSACAIAGIAGAGITAYTMQAAADSAEPSPELTAQVRKILINNPEIIIEALNQYEDQQEEAANATRRDSIAANIDKLWSLPGLHVAGNPNGKIRVVEFFDYRCGFCKRATPTIVELIEENDDLAVAFVEFPILSPASLTAAKAAVAAGAQDRYMDMHRELMTTTGSLDEARVMEIARKLGLDMDRLTRDMESDATRDIIDAHREMATALQVDGTPTFIVGTEPVTGWREDMLKKLIAAERKS